MAKSIEINTERLELRPLGLKYLETVNAYAMDLDLDMKLKIKEPSCYI